LLIQHQITFWLKQPFNQNFNKPQKTPNCYTLNAVIAFVIFELNYNQIDRLVALELKLTC